MKRFTFNKQFMVLMFLLLNCFASYAADEYLITEQITIQLTEAGTLPKKIARSKKYLVTNLKIIGEINGTDLRYLREMAGCYVKGENGKLSILDLSEARIVEGGDYYYYNGATYYRTSNDIMGACAFTHCESLTSIKLPSSVTKIDGFAFSYCTSLESIKIPSSIKFIKSEAFLFCKSLKSIYVFAEDVPNTSNGAFEGCDSKNCTVYVPKGTYDAYLVSEFGYFENIVEFDAITSIHNTVATPEVKETARYAVNGQRLTAPIKGINLVKYSDGTVKKEFVK